MVTSIDQTIEGKKVFSDIEVPKAMKDTHAVNKIPVDNLIWGLQVEHANFVLKTGDTMTGSLVASKDNYPVQGDLNKVISYETHREIFMSKKEGGRMEQLIDMGNNHIENLRILTASDHDCSKGYVDNNFLLKEEWRCDDQTPEHEPKRSYRFT